MSDLKLCPHCGGKADAAGKDDYMYIYCTECGCSTDGHLRPEFGGQCDSHINDWNTRADGWISVDDRLPRIDEEVMIFTDGDEMFLAWREGDGDGVTAWSDGECFGFKPTHWKPLPPAPTK